MKIKNFGVEIYMNLYEDTCKYNLAETCVSSLTFQELLDIAGDENRIIKQLKATRLSYGHIEGSLALKDGICTLYNAMKPENIIVTHGAIGANDLVIKTLVDAGDQVISVLPTYQQHYSIPESIGAEVKILPLTMENRFLPDLSLLKSYMNPKVKLVCINNPNNPSGAVMDEAFLKRIVEIVRPFGAYILCDEVYRGLTHEGNNLTASIADLYEKGISTSSMSKTFSLAGLRLGWIAAPEDVIQNVFIHRDYNTISCGVIDDHLAALALQHKEKIFERSLNIVRNNIEILDKWIKQNPKFSFVKPKGGTTAFVKMNFDMKSEDFCLQLLEKTGVMVLPGSAMDTEGYFRIGYAFEPEILQIGLEKITEFAQSL